jgi:hypothetical protein
MIMETQLNDALSQIAHGLRAAVGHRSVSSSADRGGITITGFDEGVIVKEELPPIASSKPSGKGSKAGQKREIAATANDETTTAVVVTSTVTTSSKKSKKATAAAAAASEDVDMSSKLMESSAAGGRAPAAKRGKKEAAAAAMAAEPPVFISPPVSSSFLEPSASSSSSSASASVAPAMCCQATLKKGEPCPKPFKEYVDGVPLCAFHARSRKEVSGSMVSVTSASTTTSQEAPPTFVIGGDEKLGKQPKEKKKAAAVVAAAVVVVPAASFSSSKKGSDKQHAAAAVVAHEPSHVAEQFVSHETEQQQQQSTTETTTNNTVEEEVADVEMREEKSATELAFEEASQIEDIPCNSVEAVSFVIMFKRPGDTKQRHYVATLEDGLIFDMDIQTCYGRIASTRVTQEAHNAFRQGAPMLLPKEAVKCDNKYRELCAEYELSMEPFY